MKAWVVRQPGPMIGRPLEMVERAEPHPGRGEVRVRVSVCGVCRSDLHLVEGDLAPRRRGVTPGHEIVGVIDECGEDASRFVAGERVGIPWLRKTCGTCRFCVRGSENLCISPEFTGWHADGGYAEFAVVDERYAYRLPSRFSDEQAAPLLCAGIIGFRSLRQTRLPPTGRLGIYGFGASAHLTAQVAMAEGARVHVMTRSTDAQRLAVELGVDSVSGAFDAPPELLDGAIIFAPAGEIVPVALSALDSGGTVAVAGIHMTDIPSLNYQQHLFQERCLRSVTANTRRDGEEFMEIAEHIDLRVETVPYAFEEAPTALSDLARDRVVGVAVLRVDAEN